MFILQVGFSGRSQNAQDVGYVLFSFFNVLWASIYLEAWKRYSAELAYQWGTLDQRDELLVEPRPLYTVCFSPINHKPSSEILSYLMFASKKSLF